MLDSGEQNLPPQQQEVIIQGRENWSKQPQARQEPAPVRREPVDDYVYEEPSTFRKAATGAVVTSPIWGTGALLAYSNRRTQEGTATPAMEKAVTALERVGPSLKPNLKGARQSVNRTARNQGKADRQARYDALAPGERVEWNRIHQERADEMKVKPEDGARGVTAKRITPLPSGASIEQLRTAPIQELINGEWKTVQPEGI